MAKFLLSMSDLRPVVALIGTVNMVVVSKRFRASTVGASKSGEIGLPPLALKTHEEERRPTCRADRTIIGQQRIEKKVINSTHNRTFGGNGDVSFRSTPWLTADV
jgi:hypothetical protein